MEKSFRLGGKNYSLNRGEIEEVLKHVVPKPIEKYSVMVNRKAYPPKQVLAVALNMPLVRFTTMDASRILANLGFELRKTGNENEAMKTESEQLFEEYLNSQGFTNFSFEKEFPDTLNRPDYSLPFDGTEILFDVKEFHATADDFKPGGGCYDPYRPLREKIGAARKKFRDVKQYCCAPVLYNREKPLVHLSPDFIYGAMLGNLAIQIPFDAERGELLSEEADVVFSSKGGKVAHKMGETVVIENTTLSAIIVLEQLKIGERRFNVEVARREAEQGKMTQKEFFEMIQRTRGTEHDISWWQLRVVVHENPYARIPLPEEIFRGPYDERYGHEDDEIRRKFVGEQISTLEAKEKEYSLNLSPVNRLFSR